MCPGCSANLLLGIMSIVRNSALRLATSQRCAVGVDRRHIRITVSVVLPPDADNRPTVGQPRCDCSKSPAP